MPESPLIWYNTKVTYVKSTWGEKMTSFLIYDDSRSACEELKALICEQINGTDFEVHTALNRQEAEKLLKNDISVLFLDIALENEENGINFARSVNKSYPDTKIIFITAYIRYCEEIFAANPSGFLVKPFTARKIARSLEILKSNQQKDDFLVISNSRNNVTKLLLSEITYIESINRKLVYYTSNGEKVHESTGKVSALNNELPDYFIRCHQSFYVNLHFVSRIQRYHFTLKNGTDVPISQNKFRMSREKFMCFLGEMV